MRKNKPPVASTFVSKIATRNEQTSWIGTLSFALELYLDKHHKTTFTLLRDIPKIFYYTTALDKHETSEVERKENLMKLFCEDRGPDIKNV